MPEKYRDPAHVADGTSFAEERAEVAMGIKRTFVVGMIGWIAACGTALGCSLASPTYITSTQESVEDDSDASASSAPGSGGSSAPSGGPAVTCSGTDFAKVDVSKLTACAGGKGHCYDKSKTPLGPQLVACPEAGKVCVPDEILKAGGDKLTSCKSVIGPGGCVSASLLPEVEKQGGGALTADVCTDGMLCLPCNDPRAGGGPTPFCQPIGVFEKECSGGGAAPGADGGTTAPTAFPACCTTAGTSNGICLPESAIPPEQRAEAPALTCAAGNKCVPKAFVEGKQVACSSLLGAGVCMDKCFDQMMALAGGIGILGKDVCGTSELCIPCALVSGKGVPGCK